MKKNGINIIFVAVITFVVVWNFSQNRVEGEFSDWALANVEALATDESGGDSMYRKYYCGHTMYYKCAYGTGESCPGPNPPYPC
jgi:hypothetical protein